MSDIYIHFLIVLTNYLCWMLKSVLSSDLCAFHLAIGLGRRDSFGIMFLHEKLKVDMAIPEAKLKNSLDSFTLISLNGVQFVNQVFVCMWGGGGGKKSQALIRDLYTSR